MAEGNRHLGYKDVLNRIEEQSPGTKTVFVTGFHDPWRRWRFADVAEQHQERDDLQP